MRSAITADGLRPAYYRGARLNGLADVEAAPPARVRRRTIAAAGLPAPSEAIADRRKRALWALERVNQVLRTDFSTGLVRARAARWCR